MGIVQIILLVLQSLPAIIKAISELIKFIGDAADSFEKREKAKSFTAALKEARETKNTSKLENLFGIERATPQVIQKDSVSSGAVKITFTKVQNVEPLLIEEKKSLDLDNVSAKQEDTSLQKSSLTLTPRSTTGLGVFFNLLSFGGTSNSEILGGVRHTRLGPDTARISSHFIPIFIAFVLIACGCKKVENQPDYKPKLWAGDSSRAQITRAQSHEYLSCTDPEFDRYIALKDSALQCLYETYILNCEAYKKAVVPCDGVNLKEIDRMLKHEGVR